MTFLRLSCLMLIVGGTLGCSKPAPPTSIESETTIDTEAEMQMEKEANKNTK